MLFLQGWAEALRRPNVWAWLLAVAIVSGFSGLPNAAFDAALSGALEDYMPLLMFLALGVLLFAGYPVAFTLAGVGIVFGIVGLALGSFSFPEFNNVLLRIWGGLIQNLLLVAIPMFVFMGITLERSGVWKIC